MHSQGGSNIRRGTDQHLITGSNPRRGHCQMQRRGSTADCHRVLATTILGEAAFELWQALSKGTRDFTGAQRGDYGLYFVFAQLWFKYRNHDSTSTKILSRSGPRKGPCLTEMHCMSSITRMA